MRTGRAGAATRPGAPAPRAALAHRPGQDIGGFQDRGGNPRSAPTWLRIPPRARVLCRLWLAPVPGASSWLAGRSRRLFGGIRVWRRRAGCIAAACHAGSGIRVCSRGKAVGMQRHGGRDTGFGFEVSFKGCWSGGRLGSIRPGRLSAIISEAFSAPFLPQPPRP